MGYESIARRWIPLLPTLLVACGGGALTNPANDSGSVGSSSTGSSSTGSSSTGGNPGGGCDAGLCDGTCCPSGTECITAPDTGALGCATICQKSSDCSGLTPCCAPDLDPASGVYTGHGDCETIGSLSCVCADTADCNALMPGANGACVPRTVPGMITGPYICVADDGQATNGCAPGPDDPDGVCANPGLSCTSDHAGNEFCSTPCTRDADCANPQVACCNDSCGSGQACCGLCGG